MQSEGTSQDDNSGVDESVQAPGRFDFWIPAMMLVLGLLLGGGLIWILTLDGSDDASSTASDTSSASEVPTVTATATPTGLEITVPSACLELADNTQEILGLVDQAVAAISDLDAAALSDIVSQLETAQSDLDAQSQACESAAGESN